MGAFQRFELEANSGNHNGKGPELLEAEGHLQESEFTSA